MKNRYKDAWKQFILQWINLNGSYEPLALLLSYYSFIQYRKKISDEMRQFYCNLFSDIFISNKFNEPLLKNLIDITNDDSNELQAFFKSIVKRAFQIPNNYIQWLIFDIMLQEKILNSLDVSLYEPLATLFFTFPIELQNQFIKNKIKRHKYLLYALIKFIHHANKGKNTFSSLHPALMISSDWLVHNNELLVYQETLVRLLECFEKNSINLDESDLKPNSYGIYFWPLEEKNKLWLIHSAQEYPTFLRILLNFAEKNKIDRLNYAWIYDKLNKQKEHYEKQIELAKKSNNKNIKFYNLCLEENLNILNLCNIIL